MLKYGVVQENVNSNNIAEPICCLISISNMVGILDLWSNSLSTAFHYPVLLTFERSICIIRIFNLVQVKADYEIIQLFQNLDPESAQIWIRIQFLIQNFPWSCSTYIERYPFPLLEFSIWSKTVKPIYQLQLAVSGTFSRSREKLHFFRKNFFCHFWALITL